MERSNRQEALLQLLDLAAAKGYVTFDDVLNTSEQFSLSIQDFNWLSENVASRNVIIYESEPEPVKADDEDVDDYAQSDYEQTFQEVIAAAPNLAPLIEEIRNIKPPQWGEVNRLKHQAKEGNEHARQRMIEMYMRIAIRIAWQRAKDYDADLEATIGDAFVGLIVAVDKYDPDHSGPFISYASMWIYQNITREQRTQNTNLYYPVHRKELYYACYPLLKRRGCTECELLSECPKAREMVRNKTDGNDEQVEDVITASLPALPLHRVAKEIRRSEYIYESTGERVSSLGERSLWETGDEVIDEVHRALMTEYLNDSLDTLTPRQEHVLRARYGLKDGIEHTLEEVGQMYGLTRERIRQIEAKSLRKLQNQYKHRQKLIDLNIERTKQEYEKKTHPQSSTGDISEAAQRVLANWDTLDAASKAVGQPVNGPLKKKRGRPRKV